MFFSIFRLELARFDTGFGIEDVAHCYCDCAGRTGNYLQNRLVLWRGEDCFIPPARTRLVALVWKS
jgi:hypothetical protein